MQTIIETLTEHAGQTQDSQALTAIVRVALGRAIIQQIEPNNNELAVMTLDSKLERMLMHAVQSNTADSAGIEPGLADTIATQAARAAALQEQLGHPPVLLVPAPLRAMLARFLRRSLPHLKVLSHSELPDTRTIKVTNIVGALA